MNFVEEFEKKQNKTKILVDSDHLKVIIVANKRSNLALSTIVKVDLVTNDVKVWYKVNSWSDHESFKFISKLFIDYISATKYYQEIYDKYKKE